MSLTAERRPLLLEQRDIDRFHRKVDRSAGPDQCWPWTGEKHVHGYGLLAVYSGGHRRRLLAHRVAFVLAGGELGPLDVVRHRCDNPLCCNPRCLESGSQADNIRDAIDRGRLNTTGLALRWGAI